MDDQDQVRRLLEQHVLTMSSSLDKVKTLLEHPAMNGKRSTAPAAGSDAPLAKVSRREEPAAAAPISTASSTEEWAGDGADLGRLREQLRAFAVARDWDQFHTPRNICLALVGEVGELAECFQWKGDGGAASGLLDWPADKKTHLGEELADVLLYLVRLADKCGVDLPAAAERKIQRNAAKYPAALVKGSAKKYNEY